MTDKAGRLDQNCSACHHDHLGRDNSLLRVASSQCISCHENLGSVCRNQPTVATTVNAFTKESHGDFASLGQTDSGVIKFDHHQHMLPGQVDPGVRGEFKLSMLDPAIRDRYRRPGQNDDGVVQLDCTSCHEMAGNPDPNQSLISDAELGRYIAPVSFEKHCSACHTINPGIATAETTPIPHAQRWSQTELLLAATVRGSLKTGVIRNPDDDSQSTPQPGESYGEQATGTDVDWSSAASSVKQQRSAIETQCLQCHDPSSITDEGIEAALRSDALPMIPPRWLKKGLYDHAAHRRVDCRYCHADAYPNEQTSKASPAADQDVVMIAGIESCTGCHRNENVPTPQSLVTAESKDVLGGMPTWASDDCTMCHRYHTPPVRSNGDTPMQISRLHP